LNQSGERKERERRASPGTAKRERGGVQSGVAHGDQGIRQRRASGGGERRSGEVHT
jgi:hypothetical protein